MSERFDPYQAWLGVPRSARPSYYQLLGLQNFESEPPVIAEAAEQAMAKVAPHRTGPNREAAERVLSKLKNAKDVLLSAEKRQAYDQQLRTHLGQADVPPAPPSAPVSAVDSPTMMLPPGALPPLSQAGLPPSAPAGFPPGYAPSYGQAPGYTPQATGFPPQAPAGYPSMPGMPPQGGYAPQAGYGPQSGFPPQPGFPQPSFQQPGFPQQGGYPPQAGYPQQGGFPQAGGYPQQPSFAPQSADPFAGAMSPPGTNTPGGFVPFSGLSQALGDVPASPPGAAPMGAGSFGAGPAFAAPTAAPPAQASLAAAPQARAAAPGFAPKQSTPAIRRGTQRRQQNSTIMVALAVLGGAVALLVVAIIAANKNDDQQAQNTTVPPVAPSPQQPAPASSPTQLGLGISHLTEQPVRVDPSFPDGGSIRPGMNPGSNVPSAVPAIGPDGNNIVMALVPEGYKPSPATPTPTGAMPVAMPAAGPSATASMPAAVPSGTTPTTPGPAPKPTPISIAGTSTGAPAMEASLPADAARAKIVQTMTKSVKASLKAREYAKAEDVALQSLVLADAPEVVSMTFEQHRAVELMRALWNGVRDGIKSLKEGDEITFNGKTAKVVRHDETTLVVQQDNKDIPLLIAKLVPGLAIQLAERALPADDSTTKLCAGVFLMVDAVGDKEKGRALIGEAGAAGAEVDKLIAWLDMPE